MAKRTGPTSGKKVASIIYAVRVYLGMLPPLRRLTYWRAVLKLLFGRPLSANEALKIAHHAVRKSGVVVVWELLIPHGNAEEICQGALPGLKERVEAARAAGRN